MPLTPGQKKALQAALERRRDALLAELRRDATRVREEPFGALAGEAPDSGDESVADLIADTDQAELSRDVNELGEIGLALSRFALGRYGVCADCGIEIDYARLRANPAALRCAACQRRHEKTHRGAPGPKL